MTRTSHSCPSSPDTGISRRMTRATICERGSHEGKNRPPCDSTSWMTRLTCSSEMRLTPASV
ncbi:hypothetical protein CH063_15634 [Colletotrichum higginsianum]|uniref:Uncharacterized protein n=1 Tax=Colletotrichum higginsianum (strain IMI 349063) TaxID=759273 RepID=H1W3Q7_COLHI|nr:hypothetical protein CH063_15634 [Colletotrichum higginsianum]